MLPAFSKSDGKVYSLILLHISLLTVCACVCARMCVCMCVHTCMHVCVHMYVHVCAHANMQAMMNIWRSENYLQVSVLSSYRTNSKLSYFSDLGIYTSRPAQTQGTTLIPPERKY